MKIQILSDIHNEISPFDPIQTDANVVVLAGDIGKGSEGLLWAEQAFPDKHIVYVPGNHEFYHGNRERVLAGIREAAAKSANSHRIHVLDNDEIIIGDVRFIGATLWTDFQLHGEKDTPWAMQDAMNYLNDFKVIRTGEDSARFTPSDSIVLHKESLQWLKNRLDEPFYGKTVVVTHHLPSMLSVASRYKEKMLSACFASNLDYLFGKMDMWVHGHTHDTFDYVENGTRVVCNPRGYVTYRGAENSEFNPTSAIDLNKNISE